MDSLKIDVRGYPDEKIRELEQLVERWKQEAQAVGQAKSMVKRRVEPAEFVPRKTRLKGPLTRALAYEH